MKWHIVDHAVSNRLTPVRHPETEERLTGSPDFRLYHRSTIQRQYSNARNDSISVNIVNHPIVRQIEV